MSKRLRLVKWFFTLYFLFFPFIVILVASLISRMQIHFASPPEWFPALRIILIVHAVVTLSLPWLFEHRLRSALQSRESRFKLNSDLEMLLLGLVLSGVPAIYGLGLFFGGRSIVELCFWAGTSFVVALAWALHIMRDKATAPGIDIKALQEQINDD
jgi:hypothetical protein